MELAVCQLLFPDLRHNFPIIETTMTLRAVVTETLRHAGRELIPRLIRKLARRTNNY